MEEQLEQLTEQKHQLFAMLRAAIKEEERVKKEKAEAAKYASLI
jgi:hypothetical protein